MKAVLEVEVVETQRHIPFAGWGKHRLPTDRPPWTDRLGKTVRTKDTVNSLLPQQYEWSSDWKFHTTPDTDSEGWGYAFDFPWAMHKAKGMNDHVRLRHWRRVASIKPQFEDVDIPVSKEFLVLLAPGGNDSFDEVLHSEVSTAELARDVSTRSRARSSTTGHWQPDSDAENCNGCKRKFQLLKLRRHHCRICGLIFCDECCPDEAQLQSEVLQKTCRECLKKTQAEIESQRAAEQKIIIEDKSKRRRLMELEQQTKLTQELEVELRKVLEVHIQEEYDALVAGFHQGAASLKEKLIEIEQQEMEHSKIDARSSIMDKWLAHRGPRQGSLTINVQQARNLPSQSKAGLLPNTRCVVKYTFTEQEYESPVVKNDSCPYYGFTSYFGISDDTKPIVITILSKHHSHILSEPSIIAISPFDIHRDYPSLTRQVTSNGVYVEKGSAILRCFGSDMQRLAEDTTISLTWTFEAREKTFYSFCDDCGKYETVCSCAPEIIQERQRKAAMEATTKEAEIYIARMRRMEIEDEEQKRLIAERQLAMDASIKIASQEVSLEEQHARHELEKDETVKFLLVCDQHIHYRSEALQLTITRTEAKNFALRIRILAFDDRKCRMLAQFSKWKVKGLLRLERKNRTKQEISFRAFAQKTTTDLHHVQTSLKAEVARLDALKKKDERERAAALKEKEAAEQVRFAAVVDPLDEEAVANEIKEKAGNRGCGGCTML